MLYREIIAVCSEIHTEHRKWYLVKHNCVTIGVFSDYNGQLHVPACTGHLQVVLGELNLRSYSKHSGRTWCAYSKILSSPKNLKMASTGRNM